MENPVHLESQSAITNAQVEKRAYQENSTPEEIAMLQTRVSLIEKNIIYYNEIPIVCPFSVNLFFDKVEKMTEKLDQPGLIINVSKVVNPDAETRKVINDRFKAICNNVSHVAFVTGKNILINTAIRFVMFGTNLKSFSVSKNTEAALIEVKKQL